MQALNYELKQLCARNRDGSFATQADRERILTLVANQLRDMGFVNMQAQRLKPKHVEKLVERWAAEGLSTGTVKNRMTELRWWAEKIGKANVVAKSSRTAAELAMISNVYLAREPDDIERKIPELHAKAAVDHFLGDREGAIVTKPSKLTTEKSGKPPQKSAPPTTLAERKCSRPPSCTQAVRDRICAHIIAGMPMRQICALPGVPSMPTVFRTLASDRSFQEQYARAKAAQMDLMAEEIIEIADDARNDWIERENRSGGTYVALNEEAIARSRVRIEARKWLMSKFACRKYGDRVAAEVSGPNAGPIETTGTNAASEGVSAAMEVVRAAVARCQVQGGDGIPNTTASSS